jgi:hypothetical protein
MAMSLPAAPTSKPSPLLPEEIAAFAATKNLADFQAAYGDSVFLLVKLIDPGGELEMGLATLRSTVRRQSIPAQPLAFHTQIADVHTMMTDFDAGDPSVTMLRRRLQQAPHFAISLEKRVATATYMERISVGRARNQDVVLRHASVSKFHAWFQRDDKGQWLVADAGSKNGTRINQDESSKRELTPVSPGDLIRFGSVEAIMCASEMLWKVARWT